MVWSLKDQHLKEVKWGRRKNRLGNYEKCIAYNRTFLMTFPTLDRSCELFSSFLFAKKKNNNNEYLFITFQQVFWENRLLLWTSPQCLILFHLEQLKIEDGSAHVLKTQGTESCRCFWLNLVQW